MKRIINKETQLFVRDYYNHLDKFDEEKEEMINTPVPSGIFPAKWNKSLNKWENGDIETYNKIKDVIEELPFE